MLLNVFTNDLNDRTEYLDTNLARQLRLAPDTPHEHATVQRVCDSLENKLRGILLSTEGNAMSFPHGVTNPCNSIH